MGGKLIEDLSVVNQGDTGKELKFGQVNYNQHQSFFD